MSQCPRCQTKMQETLTKAGVIIDNCKSCKAVWLDQGEINFFTKNKKLLAAYDKNGLIRAKETSLNCPKCHSKLKVGKMPPFNFEIEECLGCKGILLDYPELKKVIASGKFDSIKADSRVTIETKKTTPKMKKTSVKLPSLLFTSGVTLVSLYAILFGISVFLIEAGYLPHQKVILYIASFIVLQFILGPVIMDWSLRLIGSLSWVDINSLPSSFATSLKKLCNQNKIPLPKVGIIDDGSPQAYTYGRTPASARLVFSSGMFDLLNDEELEAVLAHELGHIKHWDFVIMTLAQLVPLLFYQIYRTISKLNSSGSKKNQGIVVAATVAYIFYIISEYFVLFISRLREYHADKFSCYATKNPNALLKALVKIGFGLATTNEKKSSNTDEVQFNKQSLMAVQSMGIMNVSSSKSMALIFHNDNSDEASEIQTIKEIMRWDLWSPWASYYELHSTHPLTSKRINAIATYAQNMGQEPHVLFDLQKPESYWDDFVSDLFVLILPLIMAIAFLAVYYILMAQKIEHFGWYHYLMPSILGLSIGGLIKTSKVYPGGRFWSHSVSSLLRKVKVSPVRSYPIKLKGHIVGRGEAGKIFSEDMVLQDETGIIFLDHEPYGINLFFALFKMKKFKGKDVVVEGWYRRSPVPYVEVKSIQTNTDSSTSYTYYYKVLGWCLLPLVVYVLNVYFNS